MSLLSFFNTQSTAPLYTQQEDEDKFIAVPLPTIDLNLSDEDDEEELPHPVSPDVSPAKKDIPLRNHGEEVGDDSFPMTNKDEALVKDDDLVPLETRSSLRKRLPNHKWPAKQKYPVGARVKKYFYGYDEPFLGIVTRFDPKDQYYAVRYVVDGDEEEYDEFELSQIVVPSNEEEDGLPKYGIGTQVGKWFGQEFYFGTVSSYDTTSEYYLITYEDEDEEEVEEWELSDLIAAVQENWGYKRGKKKIPRIKMEDSGKKSTPVKKFTRIKNEYPRTNATPPVKTEISTPEDLCLWANIGLKTESEIAAVLENMTDVPVEKRRSVAEFFLFIYVRQMWFRARQQQKLTGIPATLPNRAIREHVFCNMYRELDRGTQWLRQRLATVFTEDMTRREWTMQALWLCYIYRQVGRTETFLTLGFPKVMFQENGEKMNCEKNEKSLSMEQYNHKNVKTFLNGMRRLMSENITVFTGGYQTPPFRCFESFVLKAIADDCALLQRVGDAILDYDPTDSDFDFFSYHENICTALQALPGISYFFGWQIFCDLDEVGCIPRHPSMSLSRLKEGPTDPAYVLLGGGARKGLNIVFGHGTVPYSQQLEEVNFLIQHQLPIYKALGLQFDHWNDQTISCKVLEHALCVYFVYCRLVERMKHHDPAASRNRKAPPDSGPAPKCVSCSGGAISFLCDTCSRTFCAGCWLEPMTDPSAMICTQCRSWTRRYEALPWL